MKNLLTLPPDLDPEAEYFEEILSGEGGLTVERIVSQGQTSPAGFWYEQDRDEWVTVLEGRAKLAFEDGRELTLNRGEHLLLPRGLKHRVTYTSSPCFWLAVFAPALQKHPR